MVAEVGLVGGDEVAAVAPEVVGLKVDQLDVGAQVGLLRERLAALLARVRPQLQVHRVHVRVQRLLQRRPEIRISHLLKLKETGKSRIMRPCVARWAGLMIA